MLTFSQLHDKQHLQMFEHSSVLLVFWLYFYQPCIILLLRKPHCKHFIDLYLNLKQKNSLKHTQKCIGTLPSFASIHQKENKHLQ